LADKIRQARDRLRAKGQLFTSDEIDALLEDSRP
jgi:hypothetical protein